MHADGPPLLRACLPPSLRPVPDRPPGQVDLGGLVRCSFKRLDLRVAEVAKLGFKTVIIPRVRGGEGGHHHGVGARLRRGSSAAWTCLAVPRCTLLLHLPGSGHSSSMQRQAVGCGTPVKIVKPACCACLEDAAASVCITARQVALLGWARASSSPSLVSLPLTDSLCGALEQQLPTCPPT